MLAKLAAEGGGTLVDSAAEAEAADVRQQEFFAVAQSKRGKEGQIEEPLQGLLLACSQTQP